MFVVLIGSGYMVDSAELEGKLNHSYGVYNQYKAFKCNTKNLNKPI